MKNTRNLKSVIAGLVVLYGTLSVSVANAQTVWLDQLDLSTITQGYGTPKSNKSIDGNTLTIAGKTFERSLLSSP